MRRVILLGLVVILAAVFFTIKNTSVNSKSTLYVKSNSTYKITETKRTIDTSTLIFEMYGKRDALGEGMTIFFAYSKIAKQLNKSKFAIMSVTELENGSQEIEAFFTNNPSKRKDKAGEIVKVSDYLDVKIMLELSNQSGF